MRPSGTKPGWQALAPPGAAKPLPTPILNTVVDLEIGDEVGSLSALLRGVDVGDDNIGLAGFEGRQKGREHDRLICKAEAQTLADRLAEIDVETDVFVGVVGIEGFIAGSVRIDRVDERLALEHLIFGLQGGARLGRFRGS